MNNTISTTDDLQELSIELLRLQQRQTISVSVVVNDFTVKKLLASIFQQRKYRNYIAHDSAQALLNHLENVAGKHLVVYDMDTPKLNGVELLVKQRSMTQSKNLVLFLLANPLPPGVPEKLQAAGATSIINKPLTQDALIQALKVANLPA